MSLWGATVITNMLSAIPWIGQDFVQFIPLNYIILLLVIGILSINLPTVGKLNLRALRGRKPRTEEEKKPFTSVPFEFMAILAGIIDGDGYIAVTQTVKGYISIELVISLELLDAPMLYSIQTTLGIGRVNEYPNSNQVKLTINRTDLQEVFFPLLTYYGIFFLTETRRAQYNIAMYVLMTGIVKYSDIPSVIPSVVPSLPLTAAGYLLLGFFANWVVGFTVTDGCFCIKDSGEVEFSLRQRSHPILFQAFNLLFSTKRKVYEHGGNAKFAVSSVIDITTVVNFFSFSGLHPLLGLKAANYRTWIEYIRVQRRFKDVRLP